MWMLPLPLPLALKTATLPSTLPLPLKAEGVETPVEKTTGDGIKIRVDHFDGFAFDVFHCLPPYANYKHTRREPLGDSPATLAPIFA
jgi:hypothetical protein